MELQEQITHLRYLEQEYLKHKYIKNNENSLESIRTFAAWHSAAAVLFCDIIPEGDSYLKRFVEADTSNPNITPMVFNGEVRGTATVGKWAKYAEEQGYKVLAAVNGDIYDTSSGTPKYFVLSLL